MAGENEHEIGNIEKLVDSESFEMWNFQTSVFFKASGLYTLVNNEEKYETLTIEKDQKSWVQRDAKAQKIIISTVDKKVLVHIMNCTTSAGMYKKLKEMFQKDNEDQKCRLLEEFFSFNYEKGSDIPTHVSKLQNLAYRLKALKQDVTDEMLISKILSTLPERFRYFRTAWESTSHTEKTLTNLISRLLSEENANQNKDRERPVAFQCSSGEKLCHICKKPNHIARFCRNKNKNHYENKKYQSENKNEYQSQNYQNTQTERRCSICKKNNHTENSCYFRNKPSTSGTRTDGNRDTKVSFLTENEHLVETEKNLFVMDSGSTAHMVNDLKLFEYLTEKKSDVRVAKKGAHITAEGVGTINTK